MPIGKYMSRIFIACSISKRTTMRRMWRRLRKRLTRRPAIGSRQRTPFLHRATTLAGMRAKIDWARSVDHVTGLLVDNEEQIQTFHKRSETAR